MRNRENAGKVGVGSAPESLSERPGSPLNKKAQLGKPNQPIIKRFYPHTQKKNKLERMRSKETGTQGVTVRLLL